MRRAAVSIPANIAEGFKKRGVKDKIRLLNVSQGSIEESQYFLILSHDLRYLEDASLRQSLNEVGRLLEGYIKGIERRHRSS
jgi:four helix bundle protein